MSLPEAETRIKQLTAKHIRVQSISLRDEIYGTLEASAVGRGRTYHLRGGRLHQASQPGDPPARITRKLQNSIQVINFNEISERNLVAQVGPDPSAFTKTGPYPHFLEFGTRFMGPRSFMRAGLATWRARLR